MTNNKKIETMITRSDLVKTFIRSNFLAASWNFEKMQALGALYTLTPILKRLYGNEEKEKRVAAMKRHIEFFNTNPWVYAPIAGVTVAMEENTPEEDKESVIAVRTGLMGPLAGLGDSMLALTFLPILLSITAGMAINGSVLGPILFFIIFNIVIGIIKYRTFFLGYEQGTKALSGENGAGSLRRLSTMGNVVGMMVVGALIVGMINIYIPIEYTVEEYTVTVQSMLDGIMPSFIPLLLTFFIYWLLKRKNAKNSVLIIFSILAIGIVLSMLGILG
jgi:PTS system mannose-specific IID component